MSKMSQPMILTKDLLESAFSKAGESYKILSEQLDINYPSVIKMFNFNRIPKEEYLLKIEKFVARKNFKPRSPKKRGRKFTKA